MKSYRQPSPTISWFMEEKEKQRKGLDNELDQAEIHTAMKGYLNGWTRAVTKHPELFRVNDPRKPYIWEDIKHLKEDLYAKR